MLDDIKDKRKLIGLKQSISAVEQGIAKKAYVAKDVDSQLGSYIIETCNANSVVIEYVESMAELGKAAGIDVGAAVAVLLED